MRLRAEAFENADVVFIALLCVGLGLVPILVPPSTAYEKHVRSTELRAQKTVRVDCNQGPCWVRPQGGAQLFEVRTGAGIDAYEGDEVLTLGAGASVVATFPDAGGELRLTNTGVIHLVRGTSQVAVETDGSSAPSAPTAASRLAAQVATANSLIYVGEIPIKIVSPTAGTPIVATNFPTSVHLAFMVDRYVPEEVKKLSDWIVLSVVDGKPPEQVATIHTGNTEPPVGGASFYGDFNVPKPGIYALVPVVMMGASTEYPYWFEVKGEAALESQISNLLQGVTSDSDSQIEIRGQ